MAKKFRELRLRMAPERQRQAHERAERLLARMPLQELRQARALTQVALAQRLKSTQAQVSKLERRTDMYVSSLRDYVEAMGGALEIVARFPDGAVRITQFATIGEDGR